MRTKTTTIYQYDELSDCAKQKAREWFRQDYPVYEWWDYVYEDANTIATALGFDLQTKNANPAISFSGFWSQGDGACFEGVYRAENANKEKFYTHVGTTESNQPIIDIAENFFAFAKEHPTFYAKLTHTGRYSHERSVSYDCSEEIETEEGTEDKISIDTEEEFETLCRSLMKWIYRQLEKEYEYLISDEQVDESIRINEYEFTEDGRIA